MILVIISPSQTRKHLSAGAVQGAGLLDGDNATAGPVDKDGGAVQVFEPCLGGAVDEGAEEELVRREGGWHRG